MATANEASQIAFDFLVEVIEKKGTLSEDTPFYSDGIRLEAAREILKYSGAPVTE
jgi:hypothetical protein